MPHTLPDLVKQVLPEATPPLEQRLEFRRLRVTDERRHVLKATAGAPGPIPIAHASPIASVVCRPPLRPDQPRVPDRMRELPTPLIRIHLERIVSWGLGPGRSARTVTSQPAGGG